MYLYTYYTRVTEGTSIVHVIMTTEGPTQCDPYTQVTDVTAMMRTCVKYTVGDLQNVVFMTLYKEGFPYNVRWSSSVCLTLLSGQYLLLYIYNAFELHWFNK